MYIHLSNRSKTGAAITIQFKDVINQRNSNDGFIYYTIYTVPSV